MVTQRASGRDKKRRELHGLSGIAANGPIDRVWGESVCRASTARIVGMHERLPACGQGMGRPRDNAFRPTVGVRLVSRTAWMEAGHSRSDVRSKRRHTRQIVANTNPCSLATLATTAVEGTHLLLHGYLPGAPWRVSPRSGTCREGRSPSHTRHFRCSIDAVDFPRTAAGAWRYVSNRDSGVR